MAIAILVVFSALAASAPPAAAAESPSYVVSGKVLADDGTPLEGAHVRGYTEGPEGGSGDSATTAADGTFRLKLFPGKGHLAVAYPEWNAYEGKDLLVEGNVTDLTFTFRAPPPKTAIVEGRVVGADGQPVEGARVHLQQACCSAMPATQPGRGATEPGATEPAVAEEGTSPPPPVEGGEGDATTSSPEPDARIMPVPCCYGYDHGQSVTTGADGAFRFATYGGPRELLVEAKGYAQERVQVEAKDGQTVTQEVKLLQAPGRDATLKGRVVDASTGAPIANAQVVVANQEWSRHEYASTGADGSYSIRTIPGWTHLSVHVFSHAYGEPMPLAASDAPVTDGATTGVSIAKPLPGGGDGKQYYPYTLAFRLASGETTRDLKLEAKPAPTIVLQGYVVDPDAKKGVPGAQVNVWNQDTGDWGHATTDATGSYKILVRPGHYTMSSWAEGHLPGAAVFVIGEDEKLKRVDVESPEGQTRYVPCDDCYSHAWRGEAAPTSDGGSGKLAHAEDADAAPRTAAPGASPTMPAPAPGLAGGLGAESRSAAPGGAGTAYVGTGGGLPPYDASSPATSGQQAQGETAGAPVDAGQKQQVPGLGILGALAALGIAAAVLVARRR